MGFSFRYLKVICSFFFLNLLVLNCVIDFIVYDVEFAGTFCNHYFLRMLAAISGGQYDAAIALGQFVYRNLYTGEKDLFFSLKPLTIRNFGIFVIV